MIRDHQFYEMQGALSATGQLTACELAELEQHVAHCLSCRNCMTDMAAVSREIFMLRRRTPDMKMPAGMQERFVQRAVVAGIPLKVRSWCGVADLRVAGFAAVSIALVLLISFSWRVAPRRPVEGEAGQLSHRMGEIPAPAGSMVGPQLAVAYRHASLANKKHARRKASTHGKVQVKEAPASFPFSSAFWSPRLRPSYLTAKENTAGALLFPKPYVGNVFGRAWNAQSREPSFHLDFTLASLSRPDAPSNAGSTAPALNLRFDPPLFHIDSSRSW